MFVLWPIVLLAIVGLVDSLYIAYKRFRKEPLIAFIGDHDCSVVYNSAYGSVGGIPNEMFGIAYYVFVILIALVISDPSNILLFIVSFVAIAASFLLAWIQLVLLRNLCEYCLIPGIVNVLLMLLIASTHVPLWPVVS